MTSNRVMRAVIAGALGCGVSLSIAGPALADPPSDGCPVGYQLLAISDLLALGPYHVPSLVDDPSSGVQSFGEPGNGDGYVCGVPLGGKQTPWGSQVYNFFDNTLRA
jgi:hypothetical protein